MKHSFGSDNHSGVHPIILEAINKQNKDFEIAYGEDNYTLGVLSKLEDLLGGNCKAFFVMNGTGANVVALSCFVKSYNSILAPNTAHINVDECGAPEVITGSKIIALKALNGKVNLRTVQEALTGFGFQHHSQPKILSISQPTELGTLYSTQEIKELADLLHQHKCFLHIDGSRISNASAALKMPIKTFTADCGIDVLSFGGTKNGLLMGEAVIIFNNSIIADELPYFRKQACQLYSKNRFIAAQFEAYLKDDLYLKLAEHSNSMALYLADCLKRFSEIKISKSVESNAVFAIVPKWISNALQKKHFFYIWDENEYELRWMCSFNTEKKDIDCFINDIEDIIKAKP